MTRRITLPKTTDDPLTLAVAPPLNETPEESARRESAEIAAKKVSDDIDNQLRSERAARKGKKKPVKVLVLGQSESGKH
jgi:guanine nucleotide-binding protein alpha-1 subunit